MSTRKFELVYLKIHKKRRIEALIAWQKGILNKFIKIDKKNELENTGECSLNERDNKNIDISETNNRVREVASDEDNSNVQTHYNEEEIGRLDDDSTIDKNI